MRKWIIATAALLAIPMVGAAAVVYAPAEQEQLVEGHTVFTVIQVRNTTQPNREEFAAAVAVLVRENIDKIEYRDRFPGVLWFNDQYLVNPSGSPAQVRKQDQIRYPCGAVIAVNAGDALPQQSGVPVVPPTATYVESYRIKDPNDADWDVDKWSYDPDADPLTANSFLIWSVATGSGSTSAKSRAGYTQPDDGTAQNNCNSVTDGSRTCSASRAPFIDETDPAGQDIGYDRDPVYQDNTNEGRQCLLFGSGAGVQYNAVLFFFLNDLTDFAGVKDHTNAQNDLSQVSACHVGSQWPCPGDDDNREGNSHRYAPRPTANNNNLSWPLRVSEGRGNHGGSDGCGAGDIGGAPQNHHATCNIDIYFGYVASTVPTVRNYRVFDAEGMTAPYHCHDEIEYCNEEEFAPGYL